MRRLDFLTSHLHLTSQEGAPPMPHATTINATEFKATCLDLLDQLAAHKITRLTVTKRGKPVAVLLPPDLPAEPGIHPFDALYGAGRGLIEWPAELDVTASPFDGVTIHAQQGKLLSDDAE